MSDYTDELHETTDTLLPSSTSNSHEKVDHEPIDRIGQFAGSILEKSDSLIYAIVGVCFFLAALVALGYCFWNFWNTITHLSAQPASSEAGYIADAIVAIISDLLLVLIIMEVMSTVIHYLKSHSTSLRPFLFIGIVSGVRGILSIGARLSVNTSTSADEFNHAMIELGVNAAVILALGITLKLLGKLVED